MCIAKMVSDTGVIIFSQSLLLIISKKVYITVCHIDRALIEGLPTWETSKT